MIKNGKLRRVTMFLIAVAVMVAMTPLTGRTVKAAGDNGSGYPVVNSGFEDALTGTWHQFANKRTITAALAGYDGAHALQISGTEEGYASLWQNLTIGQDEGAPQVGDTVGGGFWVKLDADVSVGDFKMILTASKSDGTNRAVLAETRSAAGLTIGDWHYLKTSIVTNNGVIGSDHEVLSISLEGGIRGTIYVDSVSAGKVPPYIPVTGLNDGNWYTLTDQSFESDPVTASWHHFVNQRTIAADTSDPYYGNQAIRISGTGEGYASLWQNLTIGSQYGLPRAGETVEGGYWIKLGEDADSTGGTGDFKMLLAASAADGSNRVVLAETPTIIGLEKNKWHYLQTSPVDNNGVIAPGLDVLTVSLEGGITGTVYVDFVNAGEQYSTNGNPKQLSVLNAYVWYGNKTYPGNLTGWGNWEWLRTNGFNHTPDDIKDRENMRREIASVYYPVVGPYDSQDPLVADYHLELAKAMGVDVFQVVTVGGVIPAYDEALEKYMAAAEVKGMKAVVFYEHHQADWGGHATHADAVQATIDDLVRYVEKYDDSKAYLKFNGKFVIFIWGLGNNLLSQSDWRTIKSGVEHETGRSVLLVGDIPEPARPDPTWFDMFEGGYLWGAPADYLICPGNEANCTASYDNIYNYAVRSIDLMNRWTSQDPTNRFTMSVAFPGFNNYGTYGWGTGYVGMPSTPETYKAYWDAAMDKEMRWMKIVSLNDYPEGTAIEPTLQHGFDRAIATQNHIETFTGKAALDDGAIRAVIEQSDLWKKQIYIHEQLDFDHLSEPDNFNSSDPLQMKIAFTNGNFESRSGDENGNYWTGWKQSSYTNIGLTGNKVINGALAATIKTDAGSSNTMHQDVTIGEESGNVRPGSTVKGSIWVYLDEGAAITGGEISLQLIAKSDENDPGIVLSTTQGGSLVAGGWNFVETPPVVIPDHKTMLRYELSSVFPGTLIVDEADLYEIPQLANAGFEQAIANGWGTEVTDVHLEVATDKAFSGTSSFKAVASESGHFQLTQFKEVGTSYGQFARLQHVSAGVNIWLDHDGSAAGSVRLLLKAKANLTDEGVILTQTEMGGLPQNQWVAMGTDIGEIPDDAKYLIWTVESERPGTLYLDDASIMLHKDRPFLNGDFENGLRHWFESKDEESVIESTDAKAANGTKSVRLNTGNGGYSVLWNRMFTGGTTFSTLRKGQSLAVSSQVWLAESKNTNQGEITMRIVSKGRPEGEEKILASVDLTNVDKGSWVTVSTDSVVIPKDSTLLFVEFKDTTTGEMFIDDIKVENADIGPTADADIAADAASLTEQTIRANNASLNAISTDLHLPTLGDRGSTITWTTLPGGYLDPATGKLLKRPGAGENNAVIELTAMIAKAGGTSVIKTFSLTILAIPGQPITVPQRETDTVEPNEPTDPAEPFKGFSDIAGHWALSYLKQAAEQGIVSGYPDGTFKPNNPITRAEFIVMLMNAAKAEGEGAALTFTDNEKIGAWSRRAVEKAVKAGIVTGYGDGSFRPDARITRAEMATMVARALGLTVGKDDISGFADDSEIPQWAKGAVEALRIQGILKGRGDNRFVPNDTAQRAEAVVMLLRMLSTI